MRLNTIKPAEGAKHARKRVGRGIGSGTGKTAGRGHKGLKSRSGGKVQIGFEGGQMPLQRRLPKRGFKNINRVEYVPLNLDALQHIANKHDLTTIDFETLRRLRLIQKTDKVKVLGNGVLTQAINVNLHAFSASAKTAIENLGGSATVIS